MPKLPPKVYSYIRFSTPQQARGDSLRRQTSQAEEWCAERGLTLDTQLRDEGVSAFTGANRAVGVLGRFLAHVESGEVGAGSHLIVESLDRLSREAVLDAAMQLFGLIQKGIRVVTLSDGQEYSRERLQGEWTPLIIALAVMARANDESMIKSKRLTKVWARKRGEARDAQRPMTKRTPGWIDLVEGKYVANANVETVRFIFDLTVEGFGRREIARRLDEKKVPPFKGHEQRSDHRAPSFGWQASSVGKVLTSRAVLGEYQPHVGTHKQRNRRPDGPPIPDYYPRVIEEDLFWKAQRAIQGRRTNSAGRIGEAGAHILRGLARCATCGGPMHIINKGEGPKGGIYLRCDRNARNAGCDNGRRWRVDRLERALLRAVGFLDVDALNPLDTTAAKAATEVAVLSAQATQATDDRKRLFRLAKATDNEDEDAVADYQRAFAREKALKKELAVAEAAYAQAAADPGLAPRLIEASALAARLEDGDGRRDLRIRLSSLLREIVDRIDCDEYLGAVLRLKPRLVAKRLDGIVPYAFRSEGFPNSPIVVLIEDDATEAQVDAFLGWNDSDWN